MPIRAQIVHLTPQQKKELKRIIRKGMQSVQVNCRARVLLMLDDNISPSSVAEVRGVSVQTVYNIAHRFAVDGVDALFDKPRPGQPKKLNEKQEQKLVSIAMSAPPVATTRWTINLITERLMELGVVESISRRTVWEALKRNGIITTNGPEMKK